MSMLPVHRNEKERLAALHSYNILDTLSEEEFDRITALAAIICDAPISLISLIDDKRQWFKSKKGLDVTQTARDISFCQYAIMGDAIMEIEDATANILFKENPLVTGDPNIRFYAGCPLIDTNGHALGTLCVIDQQSKKLSEQQRKGLALLADDVMSMITERRRKEELKNFEKLFQLSNDFICIAGTDGYFKRVNPSFCTVAGWDMNFLTQTSFYTLIHPDDVQTTMMQLQSVADGEASVTFCHRFKTSAGEYRMLQWDASYEQATGSIYAIGRDISTEVKKERLLKESEEKLKAFFENSQGLMCTHDLDGKFITVNSAGASILGYTCDEILSMSLFDIVPAERHPLVTAYLKTIATNGSAKGQMVTRHKDGSLRIWMFNNVLEQTTGDTPYIIANGIDITERTQMESELTAERARLSAFVEHAPAAVAMLDKNLKYIAHSQRWLEEYRIIDRDIVGVHHYDVFRNISDEWKEVIQRSLAGSVEKCEQEIWRPEGWKHDQYLRWEVRPWYLFNGEIGGIMMYSQDITQFCLHREELKNARVLAEQASLAKSEFLANMSHEIRTPLNGVIGFTDLLLKTKLDSTQQQYLSIVNQSANGLLSIINDILDFSKIEAGKLELATEKCDLYEIACQATDVISFQVQNKGVELLLNVSPDLPRFIWTDPVRIKQILVNLLGNAAKFTEQGEIELKVEALTLSDGDSATVRFSVRDTGIGIKTDRQNKIFEAFAQEDGSTTKKYGGTGLGLTISNKLLGLMKSRLQLESVQHVGSTFYFDITVPCEYGNPVDWDNLEKIQRVLVVDDNENNRMILTRILALKNIAVTAVKNGFDALQILAAGNQFDVVIMDYHMPFMDGLETVKKMRENVYTSITEQPIVVLYSSSDDASVIKASEELNINQRLVKPVKMNDIYHSLSKLYVQEEIPAHTKRHTSSIADELEILVVEDNRVNMFLAKTILEKIAPHAKLREAMNGAEAVDMCSAHIPDIIFMDIQMPVMNGYDATTAIRKLPGGKQVPVIALTAGNVKGEKEKCIAIGMDDFLSKPFVEEMLAATLKKWTYVMNTQELTEEIIEAENEHFNSETIKQYAGDDNDFMMELLELTKMALASSKQPLQQFYTEKKLTELNHWGHRIHGTATSSGLTHLAVLARKLEYVKGFEEPEVNKLVSEIACELDLLEQHLSKVSFI